MRQSLIFPVTSATVITGAMSLPQKKVPKSAVSESAVSENADVSGALLTWYDGAARALPWRVSPSEIKRGKRPDPYRVWMSEIMLQQTTVATVTPRYEVFLTRWPRVEDLAASPIEEVLGAWAGLGYYARARNLHKCAVVVTEDFRGQFPSTQEELLALQAVGPYTPAAIASIAFDRRAIVVDGNVERVASRLFAIQTPLPKAKSEVRDAMDDLWPQERSGDFAQALMDLGATICTPRNPSCLLCPFNKHCRAHREGRAEVFPVKSPKKQKPTRTGLVYVVRRSNGDVLMERRPDKGLLGGMLGFPGSSWQTKSEAVSDSELLTKIISATDDWQTAGEISHTFTHFHLVLTVKIAPAPTGWRRPKETEWIGPDAAELPTVMSKVLAAALSGDPYRTHSP